MTIAEQIKIRWLIGLACLFFLVFGVLWWKSVYSNPERVFYQMLSRSFNLNGVAKEIEQSSDTQVAAQKIYLNNGAKPVAKSLTKVTEDSGSTTVTTERIGTPTKDYVRYVSIDTSQTREDGSPIDFGSLLGVWGENQLSADPEITNGDLYNEVVLSIVPIGRLSHSQRRDLLKFIEQEQVYNVDFASVARSIDNGRPQYSYNVEVAPDKYVKLIKKFAEYSGQNHLNQLDPDDYAGSSALDFIFTVDVWSRNLVKVRYLNGDREEALSGHDSTKQIGLPEDTIPIDELQIKLEQLQ